MKKSIIFISLLVVSTVFLSRCINNQLEPSKDPRGRVYAGSAACRQCHQAIYDSFVNSAHAKATSKGIGENIHGNFSNDKDTFNFSGTSRMIMEKRGDSYYQVIYNDGKENGAYKLDLLFGSRNAQTSAYWSNEKLYELPLSHYASADAWGTSPGFPTDFIKLGRPINENCMDCHSSNISIKPGAPLNSDQMYDSTSLIYGIDCERCHGPAINHVNYHLANPGLKTASWLVKNNMLTHQQKLDACAVCHSGNDMTKIQSRFQFKMGDTLGYFFVEEHAKDKNDIDVHGNQYGKLHLSKCFLNSSNMTCSTCHDPHKNDTKDLAFYSQKCMSCHKPETHNFCPQFASLGESIKSNCIDCHMPKQASKAIRFQLQGSDLKSAYMLRTHEIAVYRDSVEVVSARSLKEPKIKNYK